jgi:hypothetical protein
MKRLFNILSIATVLLFLSSCGKKQTDTSSLEGKKARLAELNTEATKSKQRSSL